eukprot:TRINITY_DN2091_c0_g1_i4.p1 TRINITY_DN2091_c0_g1~~TRINITY_DN2091_c0_g1_i4.p1  ORF type:complete len:313 (-),score=79.47 TRINITY_DN2091_c0_g1_i4:57-995(-)
MNTSEPVPNTDCPQMALTQQGLQQQITNGKSLRNAYVSNGFLSPTFNESQVIIRSDDMDRCIQSAQGLILGLFASGEQDSNDTPIINIKTRAQFKEHIFPNSRVCPKVQDLQNEAQSQQKYYDFQSNVWYPVAQKLSSVLGMPMSQVSNGLIWDCVFWHVCHDQPLPSGFTDDVWKQLNDAIIQRNALLNGYPDYPTQGKFQIGLLLNEMYEYLQDAIEGNDSPRFVLYSGHDSTLMPILYAYNLWDQTWTPYAAMIQVELYHSISTGSYSVRFLYDGKALKVPGCTDVTCSWSEFQKVTENLIPTAEECNQ